MTINERVIVVDFGGQYTHLISRRCRELGVYAEIVAQDTLFDSQFLDSVKGVILSGGPRTVGKEDLANPFELNMQELGRRRIPTLGICFGHQLLAVYKKARLSSGGNPEYGNTRIQITTGKSILKDLENNQIVWMSHSDQVVGLPSDLHVLATSNDDHVAAFRSEDNLIFGVQFHPEVTHTPNGLSVLYSFLREVCRFAENWTPEGQIESVVRSIEEQVKSGRVLIGTSGGVDSTVAAYLIKRAIGNRIFCVFVDNGLLREGERQEVTNAFADMGFDNFAVVDATDEFLDALLDVEDPEEKRKIIAETFIRVFERKAKELEEKYGEFEFLGQGTIYPDRVESAVTGNATAMIKSHHNVRLPQWMKLKLVEPLKDLYKDEVRKVGRALSIPSYCIDRQPFPGPSLAIRIGGPVTRNQLSILRQADVILQEELKKDNIYPGIWQSFCVLLPLRTVGVMGDERTYDQVVAIRIVESNDAMTAAVSRLSWDLLLKVSSRIVNTVRGINRVVYDVTTKPPGTIEWY